MKTVLRKLHLVFGKILLLPHPNKHIFLSNIRSRNYALLTALSEYQFLLQDCCRRTQLKVFTCFWTLLIFTNAQLMEEPAFNYSVFWYGCENFLVFVRDNFYFMMVVVLWHLWLFCKQLLEIPELAGYQPFSPSFLSTGMYNVSSVLPCF